MPNLTGDLGDQDLSALLGRSARESGTDGRLSDAPLARDQDELPLPHLRGAGQIEARHRTLGLRRPQRGGGRASVLGSDATRVFTREGNLVRRITSHLMAREPVFRGVQRALRASKDARTAVDRNVGRMLAVLNVASHQEIERLHEDVRELEREVASLTLRADDLIVRLRRRSARPGPPHGDSGESNRFG